MLRKGYVFLLVVFLCKTLTGISCNSGGNAPAGESEQIFPMVGIGVFFLFFPLFSFFSLPCGSGSVEERRTPSCPTRLPAVSDTPRCCPVQGLPTGPGTTSSAGPLPPYLLREIAQGLMHGGWHPPAARHRAPGEGKGDRILSLMLEALQKHCGPPGLLPWGLRGPTKLYSRAQCCQPGP